MQNENPKAFIIVYNAYILLSLCVCMCVCVYVLYVCTCVDLILQVSSWVERVIATSVNNPII